MPLQTREFVASFSRMTFQKAEMKAYVGDEFPCRCCYAQGQKSYDNATRRFREVCRWNSTLAHEDCHQKSRIEESGRDNAVRMRERQKKATSSTR